MPRPVKEDPTPLQLVLHYAAYIVVRVLICALQTLSLESCQLLARGLATFAWKIARARRKVIEENLLIAFPDSTPGERDRLGWRMWEHLFLFVAELAHLPRKVHETNWRQYVRLQNGPEMVALLLNQRPLILVSAHYGNFELGGYVLGLLGFPSYTVARTLDNPYLDRFVNEFRGRTGQHIIPKHGGYNQIVDVLESGGTMTFLADQYAGTRGLWIDFFGRPASTHKAIALFALGHDAQLVACYTRRIGSALQCELAMCDTADPQADLPRTAGVRQLTSWYTRHFEAFIREVPEQYWWLHRRWKDNRRKGRERRRAA